MKQWVLIGQKNGSVDTVIGYYTDPKALFDDKIEALKEGYHKFITALVGTPPQIQPVSERQIEEAMKGNEYGT